MARSDTRDDEIQKRVELVRLKARQVGNMEPGSPGLVDAAAKKQLEKLIPAREQIELAAIEVERLPPVVDAAAFREANEKTYTELQAELTNEAAALQAGVELAERAAAAADPLHPKNMELEALARQDELVNDFGMEAEAGRLGLPPAIEMAARERLSLVDRVIQQESGGDPLAVSSAGAIGLMQIMPATAADPGFGVTPVAEGDLFNPTLNRALGTEYLDAMLARYDGDEEAALIAYNAGFGRADKWLAAGRDYEPFKGHAGEDGEWVAGWADESERYVSNIMGNTSLAPERPAVAGEVTYDLAAVVEAAPAVAEAQASIAQSELAQVGAQIPGKTQAESVNDFIFPRALDLLAGIDTSYLGGEEPTSAVLENTPAPVNYNESVPDSDEVYPGSYKNVGEFVADVKSRWPEWREQLLDAAEWAAGPDTSEEDNDRAVYPGSYENVGEFVADLKQRWPEWREELVRLADIAAGPGDTEPDVSRPVYPGSFENVGEFIDELKRQWPELRISLVDLASAAAGRDLTEEVTGTVSGEQAALAAGQSLLTDSYKADILAHHAAAQGLRDMAYLPEVQLALENMNSDVLLAWSDATRGHDDLHREQAEEALLTAGFIPRAHLGEEKPSDRFFNIFAYARIDGGRASDQQRADAGHGPLRQVLMASRRMVNNR